MHRRHIREEIAQCASHWTGFQFRLSWLNSEQMSSSSRRSRRSDVAALMSERGRLFMMKPSGTDSGSWTSVGSGMIRLVRGDGFALHVQLFNRAERSVVVDVEADTSRKLQLQTSYESHGAARTDPRAWLFRAREGTGDFAMCAVRFKKKASADMFKSLFDSFQAEMVEAGVTSGPVTPPHSMVARQRAAGRLPHFDTPLWDARMPVEQKEQYEELKGRRLFDGGAEQEDTVVSAVDLTPNRPQEDPAVTETRSPLSNSASTSIPQNGSHWSAREEDGQEEEQELRRFAQEAAASAVAQLHASSPDEEVEAANTSKIQEVEEFQDGAAALGPAQREDSFSPEDVDDEDYDVEWEPRTVVELHPLEKLWLPIRPHPALQNRHIAHDWERLCGSGHAHPVGDPLWSTLLQRLPTRPDAHCVLVAADLGGAAAALSGRRRAHVTACNVSQTAQEFSRVRTMPLRGRNLTILDGSWQFALSALRPVSYEAAVLWDVMNSVEVRADKIQRALRERIAKQLLFFLCLLSGVVLQSDEILRALRSLQGALQPSGYAVVSGWVTTEGNPLIHQASQGGVYLRTKSVVENELLREAGWRVFVGHDMTAQCRELWAKAPEDSPIYHSLCTLLRWMENGSLRWCVWVLWNVPTPALQGTPSGKALGSWAARTTALRPWMPSTRTAVVAALRSCCQRSEGEDDRDCVSNSV